MSKIKSYDRIGQDGVEMENISENGGQEQSRFARRRVSLWAESALYFCAFVILTLARSGAIYGFSDGFYISAVSSYAPVVVIYPLFIVAQLIFVTDKIALIRSLVVSTAVAVTAVVTGKANRNIKLTACLTVGAISLVGCALFSPDYAVTQLVSGIITLVVGYVGRVALNGLYEKPKGFRPNAIELGCGGIILTCLAIGLASVNISGFMPVYAVAMLVGALVCELLGKGEGIIAGVCVGAGCALYSFEVTAIAHFAFVFTVYSLFCTAIRPLCSLSAVMASVVFWLYFRVDYTVAFPNICMMSAGAVAYCLIPRKAIDKLKSVLFLPSGKVSIRHLINSGRGEDIKKVGKISAIFREMAKGLRVFDGKNYDAVAEISYRIENAVCARCGRCEKAERWGALCAVSSQIVKNGRVTTSENPYFLQVNCPSIAQIFTAGEKARGELGKRQRLADEQKNRREDGAKCMLAVADILSGFNKTLSYPVLYDEKREKIFTEELRYNGVVACDALIEKGDLDKITVMVSSDTVFADKIIEVANRVFGSSYSLISTERADECYSSVKLMEKTPFDAIFAMSGVSKNKSATGDTHSFLRISPTKFIMAVCDGMGHGESANRISETAISLVESFYLAGFDSDYIIDSVNRFISTEAEESFVAFDLFVCDLYSLDSTLIKLGAPISFIITADEVSAIEGSALPLGAIGEITPCVYSERAQEGQTVLLVSDGISDCFDGNSLHAFVANYATLSPKGLTDAVLAEAKRRAGGVVNDDMTAVAVKIIRRI